MKFSVGYQYPDEEYGERFPEILQDYADSVAELYFAPGNEPGARSPAADASGLDEAEAWDILTEDLIETRKLGIRLNLLHLHKINTKLCQPLLYYLPDTKIYQR